MLDENNKNDAHVNKKDGVYLSSRHMSFAFSSALFCLFISFIGGYFLGQHNAVDRFYGKVEQESFADQVYSSLCMMHENSENEQNDAEESLPSSERVVAEEETSTPEEKPVVIVQQEHDVTQQENTPAPEKMVQEQDVQEKQYYAQLVGFGTEPAARQFAQRLRKKNIDVIVKKRRSKTAKGKTIFWYQVVTPTFSDKDELSVVVDTISQQERLKGVRIVTC